MLIIHCDRPVMVIGKDVPAKTILQLKTEFIWNYKGLKRNMPYAWIINMQEDIKNRQQFMRKSPCTLPPLQFTWSQTRTDSEERAHLSHLKYRSNNRPADCRDKNSDGDTGSD